MDTSCTLRSSFFFVLRFGFQDWLFPPVWTALYTCMGTASWLIWKKGGLSLSKMRHKTFVLRLYLGWKAQMVPLTWYGVQLVCNALWNPLFFGAKKMSLALVDIIGKKNPPSESISVFSFGHFGCYDDDIVLQRKQNRWIFDDSIFDMVLVRHRTERKTSDRQSSTSTSLIDHECLFLGTEAIERDTSSNIRSGSRDASGRTQIFVKRIACRRFL